MIFYIVGEYLKGINFEKDTAGSAGIFTMLWLILFAIVFFNTRNHLELATREYPLYVVSYFTAICAILAAVYISIIFSKIKKFNFVYSNISVIGKHSMIILIIHALEDQAFRFFWDISGNYFINLTVRLIIDLGIFYMYFKYKNKWES